MNIIRQGPSDLIIRRGCSEDLVGRQFGRLTVLEYLGFSRSAWSSYWRCRCLCGRIVDVGKSIRRRKNPTESCGCLAAERASRRQWQGTGDIGQQHFRRIYNRAQADGIEFNLSIEQLWSIFQSQNGVCALSGMKIEFGRYAPEGRARHDGRARLSTASLDRIDSSKGYIVGNVQWVHKDINKMKGVFDQSRFIALCKAVTQYHPEATL